MPLQVSIILEVEIQWCEMLNLEYSGLLLKANRHAKMKPKNLNIIAKICSYGLKFPEFSKDKENFDAMSL